MTITANIHDVAKSAHQELPGVADDTLRFMAEDGATINIFCPPHVAAATAAAFNRAMQVKPRGDALVYATDAGMWYITTDAAYGTAWQAHQFRGANDPDWMTTSAPSLEALQDAIDDIEAKNAREVAA